MYIFINILNDRRKRGVLDLDLFPAKVLLMCAIWLEVTGEFGNFDERSLVLSLFRSS